MKINHSARHRRPRVAISAPANSALAVLAVTLALAGCVAAPPPPPAPQPTPRVTPPPPATQTTAPPPAFRDWRDAPQTVGSWFYHATPNGGIAQFSNPPSATALLSLRCDRAARTVTIARAGAAPGPLPMSVTTSTQTRPLSAAPSRAQTLEAVLPAGDRLLDAMAFSRGRFAVEVNGLPTLYLPAWSEVGRVIEDCRG